MNKHESKYFNTAQCMDEALVKLLMKKEFELITVKDICTTAGVHRSTFYLHYENVLDVLKECIENSNDAFIAKFKEKGKEQFDVSTKELNELILIKEEYLVPYLEYVKENQAIFKVAHTHPELFSIKQHENFLFENVFYPILKKFGFEKKESSYMMEYYINGVTALILKWASEGCIYDIAKMVDIILICIRPTFEHR